MIATIKWTDPSIIGPVIAAVIALFGVVLTIYFSRKNKDKIGRTKSQTSILSNKTNQLQAGRDIHISKPKKKK